MLSLRRFIENSRIHLLVSLLNEMGSSHPTIFVHALCVCVRRNICPVSFCTTVSNLWKSSFMTVRMTLPIKAQNTFSWNSLHECHLDVYDSYISCNLHLLVASHIHRCYWKLYIWLFLLCCCLRHRVSWLNVYIERKALLWLINPFRCDAISLPFSQP